jgi:hypothetical protein
MKKTHPILSMMAFLLRTLGLAVIIALLFVLWVVLVGFPDRLVHAMLGRLDAGSYAIETDSVRLNGWDQLVCRRVRIYRKRVVGPPAVEAQEVRLQIDLEALLHKQFCVQRVEVFGGVVLPEQAFSVGSGRGVVSGGDGGNGEFRLDLSGCEVYGIRIESMSCHVMATRGKIRLDGIDAGLAQGDWRGPAKGWFVYDLHTGDWKSRVETAFNPLLMSPFYKHMGLEELSPILQRFEYAGAPPRVELDLGCPRGKGFALNMDGRVSIQDGTYRGVPFMRADAGLRVMYSETNRLVEVTPLRVFRQDGVVEGSLSLDLSAGLIGFGGTSTIHPRAALRMLHILTNEFFRTLVFDGPVRVTGTGVVDYVERGRTDCRLNVDARGVAWRNFAVEDCAFNLWVQDRTNTASDIRGKVVGGEFEGSAKIVLSPKPDGDPSYHVRGTVSNVDFEKLVARLSPSSRLESRGRVSAEVDLQGDVGVGKGQTAKGRGTVRIRDGRIFSLPVFGGLSAMMARIIPGLDFVLRQNNARLAFVVRDGQIRSDQIEVEGDVLSLRGNGQIALDGNLDFNVQLTLMKENDWVSRILRTLTYPISKLFEFKLKGSVDEPQWYPINFSSDLLERIGVLGRKSRNGGEP